MRDFSYLRAEEKARQLALSIYKKAESFTGHEGESLAGYIQDTIVAFTTSLAIVHEQDNNKQIREALIESINESYKLDSLLALANGLKYLDDGLLQKLTEENKEIRDLLKAYSRYMDFVLAMEDIEHENGD